MNGSFLTTFTYVLTYSIGAFLMWMGVAQFRQFMSVRDRKGMAAAAAALLVILIGETIGALSALILCFAVSAAVLRFALALHDDYLRKNVAKATVHDR